MRSRFWDVDLATVDLLAHQSYVVERVLELGDRAETQWLREHYSEDAITTVLRSSRRLSARSANFWALVFNVPRHEVLALSRAHDG